MLGRGFAQELVLRDLDGGTRSRPRAAAHQRGCWLQPCRSATPPEVRQLLMRAASPVTRVVVNLPHDDVTLPQHAPNKGGPNNQGPRPSEAAAVYMSRMSRLPFGYSSAVQVPQEPLKRRPLGPTLKDLALQAPTGRGSTAGLYQALVGLERPEITRSALPDPPPQPKEPPPHTHLLFPARPHVQPYLLASEEDEPAPATAPTSAAAATAEPLLDARAMRDSSALNKAADAVLEDARAAVKAAAIAQSVARDEEWDAEWDVGWDVDEDDEELAVAVAAAVDRALADVRDNYGV